MSFNTYAAIQHRNWNLFLGDSGALNCLLDQYNVSNPLASPRTVLSLNFQDASNDPLFSSVRSLVAFDNSAGDTTGYTFAGGAAVTGTRSPAANYGTTSYENTTASTIARCVSGQIYNYVRIGTNFTLECLVYQTQRPAGGTFAFIGGFVNGNNGVMLVTDSAGQLGYWINNGIGVSTTVIPLNTWVSVCFQLTWNGTSPQAFTVFANGTSAIGGSGAIVPADINNCAFTIGGDSGRNSFIGSISNFRFTEALRYTSPYFPWPAKFQKQANPTFLDCCKSNPKTVTATGFGSTIDNLPKFGISTLIARGTASFDVADDGAVVTDSTDFDFGNGEFTVEGWFRTYLFNRAGYLFQVAMSGGTMECVHAVTTGNLTFQFRSTGGTQTLVTAQSLTLNTYCFIVMQRRGNTFEVYFNGNLLTSAAVTGGAASTCDATGNWYIGRPAGATQNVLYGYVGNFRVTKGIARYNANFTPPAIANCC